MGEFAIQTLLFVVGIAVTIGLPLLLYRWMRSRQPSATPRPIVDDGAGGKIVPLVAAFHGIRGLPWIAIATNNLDPSLVLTGAGITYRVLGRRTRPWSDVRQVDVAVFGRTVNLHVVFHRSAVTLDANVGSITLVRQVLALLPDQSILTDRARSFVT